MGQGQEVHARRMLQQGITQGGWLMLQNCHLSLDYVQEAMDNLIEAETVEDTFRLWVTTEEHPKFPISFLQVRLVNGWVGGGRGIGRVGWGGGVCGAALVAAGRVRRGHLPSLGHHRGAPQVPHQLPAGTARLGSAG